MQWINRVGCVSFVMVSLTISGCSSVPKNPKGINNGCDILKTDDSWEDAFKYSFKKYGVPPHVIMAVIYQESRFVSDARPPRGSFLGIPTARPSTAYGYPQALDTTWKWYQDKSGNGWANRDNLPDAVDFIGWYINENHKRTGVSKWDAQKQYLAYHEGTGGYLKGSYKNKKWLVDVSQKVSNRAAAYRQDLSKCYQYDFLD